FRRSVPPASTQLRRIGRSRESSLRSPSTRRSLYWSRAFGGALERITSTLSPHRPLPIGSKARRSTPVLSKRRNSGAFHLGIFCDASQGAPGLGPVSQKSGKAVFKKLCIM